MSAKQRLNRLCKFRSGLALAALALSAAAIAAAQAPGANLDMGPHRPPMERAMGIGGDHGRWWNNPQAVEKYKFTDAQRKSMDDIFQQHRMSLIDLHASLEKAEAAMEPMIREDQPDEAKILAQIDAVAQARAELEKATARMLLELRRQLTPEQWKQLEADRTARGRGGPMGAGAHWRGPKGGPNGPGAPPVPPAAPGPNE